MNKTVIKQAVCAMIAASAAMGAQALDANHFAQSSRLAQGHWVKVAVTQTGMYEIDRQQLAEMGFSDPSRVKVYGYGGKMLSEILTEDLPDDLQQVPALRLSDKICFYGVGDVLMSKGVISLQNDRGTSYAMYISVQNELARAFNELKEELAWKKFHKHLDQLTEDQTKAINDAVPVRVSEAEPVVY